MCVGQVFAHSHLLKRGQQINIDSLATRNDREAETVCLGKDPRASSGKTSAPGPELGFFYFCHMQEVIPMKPDYACWSLERESIHFDQLVPHSYPKIVEPSERIANCDCELCCPMATRRSRGPFSSVVCDVVNADASQAPEFTSVSSPNINNSHPAALHDIGLCCVFRPGNRLSQHDGGLLMPVDHMDFHQIEI